MNEIQILVESNKQLFGRIERLCDQLQEHVVKQTEMLVECQHRKSAMINLKDDLEKVNSRTMFLEHMRGVKLLIVGIVTFIILMTSLVSSIDRLFFNGGFFNGGDHAQEISVSGTHLRSPFGD